MNHSARLIFIGNGPEREQLAARPGVTVQTEWRHDEMYRAYAQLDVLVVPSKTTPTWKEQFGRVIIEALWSGVPVVGSDSGEIPHLIQRTGGGEIFPEGDVVRLASILDELAVDSGKRDALARAGQQAAIDRFSVSAVAGAIEALIFQN
jgi:glycosyltransferase involved in cell wall biosynthesis